MVVCLITYLWLFLHFALVEYLMLDAAAFVHVGYYDGDRVEVENGIHEKYDPHTPVQPLPRLQKCHSVRLQTFSANQLLRQIVPVFC